MSSLPYRPIPARCAPSRRPTSLVTAAKSSSATAPRATSVATRRSAACSSASRATEARLSVFAIAVATSSVNPVSCASVSAGSGSSPWRLNATTMQPQSRLSALIGTPIEERSPHSREATWPIMPETSL